MGREPLPLLAASQDRGLHNLVRNTHRCGLPLGVSRCAARRCFGRAAAAGARLERRGVVVFLKCSHCVVVGASVAVLPLLLSGWARSRSLHVVPTRACATLVCTQLIVDTAAPL